MDRGLPLLFRAGIYAATILWVDARFLAQRTILTVGFDTADSTALSVQGPDENNVVWIGRPYRARLEAEAVVAAMEERLRVSDGEA